MTSPGPVGGLPARRVKMAWNGGSGGQLSATPNWDGNAFPFFPSGTARPETTPSAAATPGRPRIAPALAAGRCLVPPPPAPPPDPGGDGCWTTTSGPVADSANSESRL